MKKIHIGNLLIIILLIGVFFLILLLNNKTPLFADDWVYSGILGIKNFTQVETISDIIQSQYIHYFEWGGRSVVHSIDQVLLLMGSYSRSIAKSLIFTLFIFLIYKISILGSSKNQTIILFIIVSFVFLFFLNFEETMLWTTGLANYLVGTVLVLLFIYPYCVNFITSSFNKDYCWILTFLFFIFGIITGWTNENTVPPVILSILVFIILKKNKSIVPSWIFFGFLGLILGYLIMILAPGNYIRRAQIIEEGLAELSRTDILLFSLKNVYSYYLNYYRIQLLIGLYIFLLSITYFNKKEKSLIQFRKVYLSLFFFIGANLSSFIMIMSPIYPIRATFSMQTFLIIGNTILLTELIKFKFIKYCIQFTSILLIILLCIKYNRLYVNADNLQKALTMRDKEIQNNIRKGNFNLVLINGQIPESVYYLDFSEDSTYWLNKAFCKYYGLNTIRIKDIKKDIKKDE